MPSTLEQISSLQTLLALLIPRASPTLHLTYMASTQVDATQVEELTKPSEETAVGSPTIEESAKAPAPQNIGSPYDDDDEEPEDVVLPDELGKEEEEEDQTAVAPQIIEDEDDDEEEGEEQVDKTAVKSACGATDFSEEEGDGDD